MTVPVRPGSFFRQDGMKCSCRFYIVIFGIHFPPAEDEMVIKHLLKMAIRLYHLPHAFPALF
jgi:hypothetical protein